MTFTKLYDLVSALSTIEWVVVGLIWLVTTAALQFVFFRWAFRRSWSLYRNLKRPILLLRPTFPAGTSVPGSDLSSEYQLIKDNGFLNVRPPGETSTFNPARNHCIVVVGYRPGMLRLEDIVARIKSNHVPLILYTYGNTAVAPADKTTLDSYPYVLMANFPLTLLNHIFSTASSFPYDRS